MKAQSSRQQLKADFEAYLDGFSPKVRDILENGEDLPKEPDNIPEEDIT